jgi:hypothetical protein
VKSPVYLAINEDGSPLLEGDTLVVFERAEDADMAASYLGEDAGVVVTSPQRVVQRAQEAGMLGVAFVPSGAREPTLTALEDFSEAYAN